MPKMLILDGNSLAYRAFYALPVLTTPDGRPTNVLHGFMMMLLRLQAEQKPDYWLVAFDKTKAHVRIEQYEHYKAHRKETPEGLIPQFDYLKEVLAGFSVPTLELAGYEADDLIATVSKQAEEKSWEVIIYTGDRDALQLISPQTQILLTKKGISEVELYDEKRLWERYQLTSHQIIDLKGLMGDVSDNIPGVPGIGEKTALKLLWEFKNIENVLANRDKISGKKLPHNLEVYAEQAMLSKRLATMIKDTPIEFTLEECAYKQPQSADVLGVLHKYSLRNVERLWRERYGGNLAVRNGGGVNHPSAYPEKISLKTDLDVNRVEIQSKEHQPLLLSFEANELFGSMEDPAKGAVQFVSDWPERNLTDHEWLEQFKKWHAQETVIVLAYRFQGNNLEQRRWQEWAIAAAGKVYTLARETISAAVEQGFYELLSDQDVRKIVADSKELYVVLSAENIFIKGIALDLSLAAYLINSARTKFDPWELVKTYYSDQLPLVSTAQEAAALAQVVLCYVSEINELGLADLLRDVEQPLALLLAKMELHGIAVDGEQLKAFGQELKLAIQLLEMEIYSLAEKHFNINSSQQLGYILFEKLGLPPAKKTKTGYSTDAETLEDLRTSHPIVEKILEYRQLSKLMSTYVDGLLVQIQKGRVHTTLQQKVTTTGRLSSTEPNLQNIPVRLEYGRQLRKVFKPTEKDWLILSADYSQIELRILAHYSRDEVLCESFRLGQDVHARTAAEVFGIPLSEVTSDLRRKAKAVNFGLIYGLTEFGLARNLGIPRKEARFYIEQYFARYSGVKRYLEEIVKRARQEGQVRTLMHRRRRIPELYSSNRNQRLFGQRIAMNTPIQGTAADIMKVAMLRVDEGLKGRQAVMLLQVHDELLLQVAPSELGVTAEIVRNKMENAFKLSVPLTVDCKAGPDWYDLKPIDKEKK
ncbi:MAG: DNA polymerase I [Desulfitobacteriaceae bacterium]|nr:DNA polymerase I [Desulfitobacteriaceae bacterium]MDD4345709.1 DNA polymerase I [Desulfitobacteriaceae bacterium]